MSTFNNNKSKRIVTTVLLCVTGAVGLLFAILGAEKASRFFAQAIEFIWYRFKGFVVGCLFLLPIWLIWWIVSSIIDNVQARRERESRRTIYASQPSAGTTGMATETPVATTSNINVPNSSSGRPILKPVCPSCGIEVKDNGRFCRNCGWDFTRPIEEATIVAMNAHVDKEEVVAEETQGGDTEVEVEKEE